MIYYSGEEALLGILGLLLCWILFIGLPVPAGGPGLARRRREEGCTPEVVSKEKAACAECLAREQPELAWLTERAESEERLTAHHNRQAVEHESATAEMQQAIYQQSQEVGEYQNALAGAAEVTDTLVAWHRRLAARAAELETGLDELERARRELAYVVRERRSSQERYREDRARLIQRLNEFLGSLRCTRCQQVEQLLAKSRELPQEWQVKDPAPRPHIPGAISPGAPPAKPAVDPPPPDRPERARPEPCRCHVTAGVEAPQPLQLVLGVHDRRLATEGIMLTPDDPSVVLTATAFKTEMLRAVSQIQTNRGSSVADERHFSYLAAGVQLIWQVRQVRVLDERGSELEPEVTLRGRMDQEGHDQCEGAFAIVQFDLDSLFAEWDEEYEGIERIGGKLVDLEVVVSCTAGWQGESLTGALTLRAEGIKFGEPGRQVDRYMVRCTPDPELPPPETLPYKAYPPAPDCGLTLEWKPPEELVTVRPLPDAMVVRTGEPVVLGFGLTDRPGQLRATAGSMIGCTPGEATAPMHLPLQIRWECDTPDTKGWMAIGSDLLFTPYEVEQETPVSFTAVIAHPFGGEERVSIGVTVAPAGDLMHWWGQSDLLRRLHNTGSLDPEQLASFREYGAHDLRLWHYTDMGVKFVYKGLKLWRSARTVRDRWMAIAKDPVYAFEISTALPPEFAGVPKRQFAQLHPLKRVVEPLVGAARLGDLLTESTGPDYFYRGGNPQTLDQAFKAYFENVTRPDLHSEWQVPNQMRVNNLSRPVRARRLRQAAALRCNEVIRYLAATELGLSYKPKIPLVEGHAPRILLQKFGNHPPELHFLFTEETKLKGPDGKPMPQRFRISMQVRLERVQGQWRVKSVGDFVNFVMEVDPEQRTRINGQLAEWQVPEAARYNAGPPEPHGPQQRVSQLLSTKSRELALQSWKNWAVDTAWRRATGSAAWSAGIYFFTEGFSAMVKGYKEEGTYGALKGFGRGMLGAGAAAATSFLTQVLFDFAERCGKLAATRVLEMEQRYLAAFASRFGKAAGASLERQALRHALRAPFVAGWVVLRTSIPVIGLGLLVWDAYTLGDEFSKVLGNLLFAPRPEEEAAWRNRLYAIDQRVVEGVQVVHRGIQVRLTDRPDLLFSSDGQAVHFTMLAPRITQFTFPDGAVLEMGDEVIGPKTEGLPLQQELQPLLPPLPFHDLGERHTYEDAPYMVAQNPWFFTEQAQSDPSQPVDPEFLRRLPDALDEAQWQEDRRKALALHRWGEWRERHATQWIKLEYPTDGPDSPRVTMLWWRNFYGREGYLTRLPDGMVHEGHFDLQAMLQDLMDD
ncbi:MAG: hypothetical protein ACOY94_04020 [Bacillota bacterium]